MSIETVNFNIKLPKDYKIALRQLAEEQGETISVIARVILWEGLMRRGYLQSHKRSMNNDKI